MHLHELARFVETGRSCDFFKIGFLRVLNDSEEELNLFCFGLRRHLEHLGVSDWKMNDVV